MFIDSTILSQLKVQRYVIPVKTIDKYLCIYFQGVKEFLENSIFQVSALPF